MINHICIFSNLEYRKQEEGGQKGKMLLIHCLWKSFLNRLSESCQIVRYCFFISHMTTELKLLYSSESSKRMVDLAQAAGVTEVTIRTLS